MKINRIHLVVLLVIIATLLTIVDAIAGKHKPVPPPMMLDKLVPNWSQILPSHQRFELVMDDFAVLDKETGLVWVRNPWDVNQWNWDGGRAQCMVGEGGGGRYGWHLPTFEQLASLLDMSSDTDLKLPEGHPFGVIGNEHYWTATPYPGAPGNALMINFSTGDIAGGNTGDYAHIWCVRGGQSYTGE